MTHPNMTKREAQEWLDAMLELTLKLAEVRGEAAVWDILNNEPNLCQHPDCQEQREKLKQLFANRLTSERINDMHERLVKCSK